MTWRTRTVGVVVSLVLVMASSVVSTPPTSGLVRADPPTGSVSWLSTGDSYASGEGIAGTGVGSDLCAQSTQAYGPAAAAMLREQRGWTIGPEAFSACTGHVTADLFNRREGAPSSLYEWAVEQGIPADGRFDVLTFSFGGNDIGFGDVLLHDCVLTELSWSNLPNIGDELLRCSVTDAELEERLDRFVLGDPSDPRTGEPYNADGGFYGPDNTQMSLVDFYRHLAEQHLTDRGVLVVAGYPRLFAPSNEWGDWRGGRCQLFSAHDADMLGRAGDRFDELQAEAVRQADPSGARIRFLSRRDLWRSGTLSHELCGGNTSWTNGITAGVGDGSGRFFHSFHPNEQGHAATAEALAGVLDGLLGETPPPSPSTPAQPSPTSPPVTSGSRFGIGDSFAAECIVAWPTAPMRSSTSTSMRTTCLGVPGQFLFVDITYPDPDLALTPSTGYFDVRGEVIEVSESEYGFGVLVVFATEIDL